MSADAVELPLVALAAMLSPTTLTFSVLALVLSSRPRRTGFLFYAGALGATLAIGVAAAFVLGDAAASRTSTPKTWVGWFDVVAAVFLLAYLVRAMRRRSNARREDAMAERMAQVADAPALAVVGAGAALANAGAFIPIALKSISQTDPTVAQYIAAWVGFSLVSLLPLAAALVSLLVARDWTLGRLQILRTWLERNVRNVAAVIVVFLAVALLRNGLAILI